MVFLSQEGLLLKKISLLISTVMFLTLFTIASPTEAKTNNLVVHFINVGQGDSIYIKTANGDDILIDGGNRDGSDVVAYLKKQKVNDIEVMISTHPDADHMGGLDEVLNAFKVKAIYAPKVTHTTQVYKDFLTSVKREGVKIQTAQKGVKIPLKGVTAQFVAPVKTYGTDLNDWSAVLRLVYGKKSFLFTGDAEFKSEADMIQSNQPLKADVLKVGHHGAKTSTSDDFLKAVKPTYAVISVGKGNSYGHPTADTLNRLKNNNVKIFRTDTQGSILATTNGNTLSFNAKPTISTAKPSTKPIPKTSTSYKLVASLDNVNPKQYSTIHLNVKGLPVNTSYKSVFHYKSKDTLYNGKIGSSLPVKISRASTSFRVIVDVSSTYKGKIYKTQTSFIPK
jgi:competence protein ComEC